MTDIWKMLEEVAPAGCEAVQDLYSWSLNYDHGRGPFPAFLDLIGWSDEEYGADLYDWSDRSLGHVELSKLAGALGEYASRPHDVSAYVSELMAAESNDGGYITEGTAVTIFAMILVTWIASQAAASVAHALGVIG